MFQVHKLILQQIRQEIPGEKALEVQEPEEALEVLEAAVLPEEEARLLETLEEEVQQVQEQEQLEATEEKETLEVVAVNNALDNKADSF